MSSSPPRETPTQIAHRLGLRSQRDQQMWTLEDLLDAAVVRYWHRRTAPRRAA